MKELIYNLLNSLNYPVSWLARPELNNKNPIVISFHFFNEGPDLFGDGESLTTSRALQIDVFSYIDYTNAVKAIQDIMHKNKIRFASANETIENLDTKQVFHKILIYNIYESEVKNAKIL